MKALIGLLMVVGAPAGCFTVLMELMKDFAGYRPLHGSKLQKAKMVCGWVFGGCLFGIVALAGMTVGVGMMT